MIETPPLAISQLMEAPVYRTAFWILFGLTAAIYAVIVGWSLPVISAAADGLAPFDMRPGGYQLEEATAFLEALSAEGADFYRTVQHRLDIFYPPMLAVTLFLAIANLAPRRLGLWRYVLGAVALPIAAFDYLENHAVGTMLDAGAAGLTEKLVEEASRWTVLKSLATTVSMSLLLLMLITTGAIRLLDRHRRLPARDLGIISG